MHVIKDLKSEICDHLCLRKLVDPFAASDSWHAHCSSSRAKRAIVCSPSFDAKRLIFTEARIMTLTSVEADADLERRVFQYLLDRHMPGLRRLSVEAEAGKVTLRGSVRTFYEKQLCQSIARRVAGVRQVVDQVSVGEPALQLA
jgi:hypothetical protein